MPVALALGAGLVGIAATTAVARRESRIRRDRTLRLFDGCRSLFETSRVVSGPDGYPRLDGFCAGRSVQLAAVPDTLTLKRLPQLWLAATLRPASTMPGDFAVLARPTGAEFFALTHRLPLRLDVPEPLSPGLLARGGHQGSQGLLDAVAESLADIFAEPTRQGNRRDRTRTARRGASERGPAGRVSAVAAECFRWADCPRNGTELARRLAEARTGGAPERPPAAGRGAQA